MGKIIELTFSVLIGGSLGALLGCTGQCPSGACPLAAKFNVQGIPTLLFFGMDGKIAETSKGLVTAAPLRAKLEALTGE